MQRYTCDNKSCQNAWNNSIIGGSWMP